MAVLDDPYADQPLGAQHDVRYLGDGVISIYDNGTDLGRAPRAIRYRIDGGSASLIDELTEPLAPDSRCCGSARYSKGRWLVSWGGEPLVSEFGRNGRRTFKLELGDGAFSYRALGVRGLGRRELRAGMNAQVRAPALSAPAQVQSPRSASAERLADAVDLRLAHRGEEGQREQARRGVLGDRELSLAEAEALAVVRASGGCRAGRPSPRPRAGRGRRSPHRGRPSAGSRTA